MFHIPEARGQTQFKSLVAHAVMRATQSISLHRYTQLLRELVLADPLAQGLCMPRVTSNPSQYHQASARHPRGNPDSSALRNDQSSLLRSSRQHNHLFQTACQKQTAIVVEEALVAGSEMT